LDEKEGNEKKLIWLKLPTTYILMWISVPLGFKPRIGFSGTKRVTNMLTSKKLLTENIILEKLEAIWEPHVN